MPKIVPIVLAALIAMGGCTMHEKTPEERPIVRVAVGMDPAEVVQRSTYPLDFNARGQPFADKAFMYGDATVTADITLEIIEPHNLTIKGIRYLGIGTQFDRIEMISASHSFLTLDEAIARAKDWVAKVEAGGWRRSSNKKDYLYSTVKKRWFKNWDDLRTNFVLPGRKKILGAAIGTWHSADGQQIVTIALVHKRPDGGPRYEITPDPVDPLNDHTYLLDFSVGYSDKVRAYRGAHFMELREQALQRNAEARKSRKLN